MARPRFAALVSFAITLVLAASAFAAEPNWEEAAQIRNVEIVTHDENGDERETTIWLVVVDGQGFIRTGTSTWGQNIQRNPSDVVLRIEDAEYPLKAELIENDTLRERIVAAFREKYGWQDATVSVIRGSRPLIMHLIAR